MEFPQKIGLEIVRINKDIPLPKYMYKGDAGMDVCSAIDYEVKGGEHAIIPTGLKLGIPYGYEIQIRPRSGLAAKHKITILNSPGTIDHQYRGELKVVVINHSNKPFKINKGDRIAQMVLKPVVFAEVIEKEELEDTQRSNNGFGSTGL